MIKAGVCTIIDKSRSIDELISIIAQTGADGVELWSHPPHISYPPDEKYLKNLKKCLDDNGLEAAALGSYLRPGRDIFVNDLKISIETEIAIASALGIQVIRIWPGMKNYDEYSEEERKTLIEEIRSIGRKARAAEIMIVLERHVDTILNDWSHTEEIMKDLVSDNVFLNYQIVWPAAVSQYKANSVKDYTSLLKYSRHAHLQNYSVAPDGQISERSYLDQGVVDYSSLPEAVLKSGYKGYFMVEFPAIAEASADLKENVRHDINYIKSLFHK